ncbi:ABC transporter permease [Devosia yakushimensis]|uniref:ABC transporter permease n=1 Tax=Devosia yakushimensis TaxID=470028 RepID=A0ABQ5UKA2_9HYPH|nr:ABC transporter permease [Devosia yakushimensis]GLQ11886.1 ABC transporter permease [Devosia yakushimensis]
MTLIRYIAGRLVVYALVIMFALTVLFFVPRLGPTDPIEAMLAKVSSQGAYMDAAQVDALRQSLADTFGLGGSLWEQYGAFIKRIVLTADFGPSLSMYPTPVMELIRNALPWTFGLLLTSTLIAWVLGNFVGLLSGWKPNSPTSRVMEGIAICLYPIPYYILALVLSILFSYVWKIFPLTTTIRGAPWSWELVTSVVWNSFLPAMSIVIVVFGWWVISVKAQTTALREEEFVRYARLKGLGDGRILTRYVLPNAILPQITFLALQIGLMFNGSLITEILFDYPGLGLLIYSAVLQGDFNLLMGTISLSVIAVATATMVIDLIYPLLDPRIRHR